LRALDADAERGLSSAEASQRLAQYGKNVIAPPKERSALSILAHQFSSLIVGLLVAAGGIAMAVGETAEALAILIVIVLYAVIGFVTEWKAASALAGLRKQTIAVSRVLRDGEEKQMPAADLVPGDIVLLDAGARVPADGRIIEQAR
jgi:Ca2+-transporting ATPase